MTQLKDCPFCGTPVRHDDLVDCLYPTRNGWQMCCNPCYNGCDATIYADTREEAIAAWNRRASDECRLPDLPEPLGEIVGARPNPPGTMEFWGYFSDDYRPDKKVLVYSEDNMREYARAAASKSNAFFEKTDRAAAAELFVIRTRLKHFPVMLRKMWTGAEVQRWIDETLTAEERDGDRS